MPRRAVGVASVVTVPTPARIGCRLQFALAGMNAHINRDLPAGDRGGLTTLGGDPGLERRPTRGLRQVNGLLQAVEAEIKADFATGHRRA